MLTLVHCGYHKCLTVFVARCFTDVLGDRFRDFHGYTERFHAEYTNYVVSALSDARPDVARIGDFRVSRFIRDPRDLIVSGYLYHRKGLEGWISEVQTEAPAWRLRLQMAGLLLPTESFSAALQRLDQEDGLIAEMLLRHPAFRAMNRWPANDRRIRVWKYEDILGHEVETMDAVAEHYGWRDGEGRERRALLRERAEFWRAGDGRLSWDTHVRNPQAGQWRSMFTPKVHAAFDALCGDLPRRLGYEAA